MSSILFLGGYWYSRIDVQVFLLAVDVHFIGKTCRCVKTDLGRMFTPRTRDHESDLNCMSSRAPPAHDRTEYMALDASMHQNLGGEIKGKEGGTLAGHVILGCWRTVNPKL